MDGTLAAIFFILGLGDMILNDCPTGCLDSRYSPPTWNFQAANVLFDERQLGQEVYLGFDSGQSYGPFAITYGGSLTDESDMWVGVGAKWTSQRHLESRFFFEASVMPGLHVRGDGPDLGGALQFRSAVGAGYRFENGASITVLYDHRSNADLQSVNPGLETFGIRYAVNLD